jgi:hypothetical protein
MHPDHVNWAGPGWERSEANGIKDTNLQAGEASAISPGVFTLERVVRKSRSGIARLWML